jgi:hypothetical protein
MNACRLVIKIRLDTWCWKPVISYGPVRAGLVIYVTNFSTLDHKHLIPTAPNSAIQAHADRVTILLAGDVTASRH